MNAGRLLAAMLHKLASGRGAVTEDTTLAELPESGLDDLDLVLAVVTLEVIRRVEVPDAFLEKKDWTVKRLARHIARLPKQRDPLFPLAKLHMIYGMVEDAAKANQVALLRTHLAAEVAN